LGRALDNLGKDIHTVASRIIGVGDQAKVYAVNAVTCQQLAVIN
jgi:hypothetical protein